VFVYFDIGLVIMTTCTHHHSLHVPAQPVAEYGTGSGSRPGFIMIKLVKKIINENFFVIKNRQKPLTFRLFKHEVSSFVFFGGKF
jgi:hypothetical protein